MNLNASVNNLILNEETIFLFFFFEKDEKIVIQTNYCTMKKFLICTVILLVPVFNSVYGKNPARNQYIITLILLIMIVGNDQLYIISLMVFPKFTFCTTT